MTNSEIYRIKLIIERSVKKLELDLSRFTVLTEVGSGYFVFTPIIAAMANAKKIYAWTRDSQYGKAEANVRLCRAIMNNLNLKTDIEFAVNERPEKHIASADIITNLGFVRPIHESLLKHVSSNCVVSGMCEGWELRPSDINVQFCLENKIPIAGVWENHPDVKIFDACGHLAVKMSLAAGYEVYQNIIIVWSDDHFGDVISKAFKNFGAKEVIVTTDIKILMEKVKEVDFIFFSDYDEMREIIGESGFINLEVLKEANNGIGIVHLYGNINSQYIKDIGLNVYPTKNGKAMAMTFTLAHLGPIPMINLHAAGLKVGELLQNKIDNSLVQMLN